jgi:hypothetical protein
MTSPSCRRICERHCDFERPPTRRPRISRVGREARVGCPTDRRQSTVRPRAAPGPSERELRRRRVVPLARATRARKSAAPGAPCEPAGTPPRCRHATAPRRARTRHRLDVAVPLASPAPANRSASRRTSAPAPPSLAAPRSERDLRQREQPRSNRTPQRSATLPKCPSSQPRRQIGASACTSSIVAGRRLTRLPGAIGGIVMGGAGALQSWSSSIREDWSVAACENPTRRHLR